MQKCDRIFFSERWVVGRQKGSHLRLPVDHMRLRRIEDRFLKNVLIFMLVLAYFPDVARVFIYPNLMSTKFG
jgi:hypothetical protein